MGLFICDEVDWHALDCVFDLFCAVVDEVGQLFHFAAGLVLGGIQEFLKDFLGYFLLEVDGVSNFFHLYVKRNY